MLLHASPHPAAMSLLCIRRRAQHVLPTCHCQTSLCARQAAVVAPEQTLGGLLRSSVLHPAVLHHLL
eukprot:15484919-Alexandrium_andersonii.AAC.1